MNAEFKKRVVLEYFSLPIDENDLSDARRITSEVNQMLETLPDSKIDLLYEVIQRKRGNR